VSESILEEAQRLTHGERGLAYGPPHEDYGRVAAMFNALMARKLKEPLTPADMALAMCCVKLSRQANSPKRDNMVDLAGYAYVVHACCEPDTSAQARRDAAAMWQSGYEAGLSARESSAPDTPSECPPRAPPEGSTAGTVHPADRA
jgi:Domain of unknown function (DUF6378)